MTSIDLCIVAGRRPALLERTLSSFHAGILSGFDILNVYANIDPVFGDEADQEKTEKIIRSFFPAAKISTPMAPGFCAAVKRNWIATTSDILFHMEDDWIVNEPVDPAEIESIFSSDTKIKQISLNNFHKHWNYKKGTFHQQRPRKKMFGIKFKFGKAFPCFTTSPSFIKGDFAREVAGLYDIRYDPEKQFYNGTNSRLEELVKPYKNYIYSEAKPFIITDIGREWRDERKISKAFINGTSVWRPPSDNI